MIPNIYFKILICAALLCVSFVGGFYVEHLRFAAFKEKVSAEGKVQQQKNKDIVVQQQLITKQVQNDYQNKLDRIKSYYGGMYDTSKRSMSISSTASSIIDGTPSDPQFIEKCAATTLQLESLQDFIKQQVGIK